MKKLLFQFDTDAVASTFDTVVAYDGGADQVISYPNVSSDNTAVLNALVDGIIYTRAPKSKKNSAIFVGGSQLQAGERVLNSIKSQFYQGFRVSVMLDSNGSNTTAAALVAKLAVQKSLAGKKAVVLAGTGPVGQRAAIMLAREGAEVTITSRKLETAQQACKAMFERFGAVLTPVEAADEDSRRKAIAGANIVVATGATGIELLSESAWRDNPYIEMMSDANARPPLGIGGTDMMDNGTERHGKLIWGAIGFGALKLALHRACIGKLFEENTLILDAENIYQLAKEMA